MSKLAKTLQAAAGNAGGGGEYVEDVFSTYLYAGNSSTQNVPNGIDLAGEGGMAWIKVRNESYDGLIYDTERGPDYSLKPSSISAQAYYGSSYLSSFNADGFSIGNEAAVNQSSKKYVSWTFRKAPKFFDVVTYTGDSTTNRAIPHNLGSTPGFVIVKRLDGGDGWNVWHRSLADGQYWFLNSAGTPNFNSNYMKNGDASNFYLGSGGSVNYSGLSFVMYLFAHDAGGFGDDGEQNVISCGSYTGNGSTANGPEVDLGWEPQWIMVKNTSQFNDPYSGWIMFDTMRGLVSTNGSQYIYDPYLWAQNSNAEEQTAEYISPTATGFKIAAGGATAVNANGSNYIYIAIRRGPMKTPESGTEVFAVAPRSSTAGYNYAFVSNFPVDMGMSRNVVGATEMRLGSRLQGDVYLQTPLTSAEASSASWYQGDSMNSVGLGFSKNNEVPIEKYGWMFRRAPSVFDVVCYTGNSTARTLTHNLTVAPELIILKSRSSTRNWVVYPNSPSQYLYLNASDQSNAADANWWNSTASTSSVFSIGAGFQANEAGASYVAYLFATCPGVSKVGSYVGNGTSQTIDCGFSAGARFVMVKRSSNSGSWLVFDSARGIVSGNDPYLQLNNTDAEVTNTDRVDPAASGFTVNFIAGSDVDTNVNDDTYIFLAIA
jgi:hypothetical protein